MSPEDGLRRWWRVNRLSARSFCRSKWWGYPVVATIEVWCRGCDDAVTTRTEASQSSWYKGRMEWVTLRTGEHLPASTVQMTVASLKILLGCDPAGFEELVAVCRNPQHQVQTQYRKLLESHYLLQDARPRPEIRAIVLAAVEGDGLDLHVTDPISRG